MASSFIATCFGVVGFLGAAALVATLVGEFLEPFDVFSEDDH